jgi:hypothetical protein
MEHPLFNRDGSLVIKHKLFDAVSGASMRRDEEGTVKNEERAKRVRKREMTVRR